MMESIYDIIFGLIASFTAFAALYMTYRQLRAMRQPNAAVPRRPEHAMQQDTRIDLESARTGLHRDDGGAVRQQRLGDCHGLVVGVAHGEAVAQRRRDGHRPALLLAADVLGRLLLPTGEVPVAIVTAFLGAPVLIWVVRRYGTVAL